MRLATISLIFLFFILPCRVYSQVQSRIDSLENLLETAEAEEIVNLFNQLSEQYWQRSYDTSLLMAIHAYNAAENLNDPELTATSLYMIGNAYYLLGDYASSMDYYLQALEIREELGDSSDLASSYNNIGAVYLNMNDDRKALSYFKKSGDLFSVLGDDDQLFPILNNIGAVYVDNSILDTAYIYFSRAYEIAERSGDQNYLSIALANLGEVTLSMGRFRESENYQSEAYEISSSLGDMGMMATIKTNLGKLYLQQKQYEKALKSFQESLVLAREINSLPAMQESYKNLSDYYTMRGEYKQALRLFKLQSAVTDSIMSKEGLMQIKELELQFNARALEQEIELLRKDNEIQRLSRTRLQYGIILLVILILALSLLFIGYHQRNQYKKKTTRLLEEKNEQLENANRQLQESEKHLKELNSTKDKFFSIIGHDLRNPLNALLGFSELISGNSNEYTTEEIQKYSKIINEAAKNIHLLIENLLEWSRSQSGKIDFNPLETAFAPIMQEIISIFEIQAEKKGIILESDIPEGLMVYADVNLLSTILRNLVNNAVKFTPKNGKVNLDAVQSEQGLRVTVRDTGVGITKEQLDTLFSLAHGPSTPGTAEEKGTGLGLILCKEFVDKHKGTISAESEPGKGSTFTLVLPNKNQPEA